MGLTLQNNIIPLGACDDGRRHHYAHNLNCALDSHDACDAAWPSYYVGRGEHQYHLNLVAEIFLVLREEVLDEACANLCEKFPFQAILRDHS